MNATARRVRVLHFVTGGFSGGATQVAIQLVNAARDSAEQAAPDAAGQCPVQDIHRPVGVASEDALRAYADAAPAPDAMILVEFKRNHRQSFGSVSERTPFPGGFPPFVS